MMILSENTEKNEIILINKLPSLEGAARGPQPPFFCHADDPVWCRQ